VRQLEKSGLKKLRQSDTVHAVYNDHYQAPGQERENPSSATS
jgi:hypothetical protein